MILITGLFLVLLGFGIWEYRSHLRNVRAIPVRVHVNGTRGKSSLTRLIAGGLRAGKVRTIAKTTGTTPRLIHEDGSEYPVFRPGKANIIEQVKVFHRAANRGAEAIVVECMAVQPALQKVMEEKLVRSTVGVISNARADHLDEMGPTLKDVARSLCNTIPRGGILFTAEGKMLPVIREEAKRRGTEVRLVKEDEIPDTYVQGFRYVEHKENVALAVAVCEHLGVKREVAIRGMTQAAPDPGVLRIYRLRFYEKTIDFVNAFAANDPDSTLMIWNRFQAETESLRGTIVIANCRPDRLSRSEQLGELIAQSLRADHYILAGDYTQIVQDRAFSLGVPREKLVNLGGHPASEIFERVVELSPASCVVFGIGNIVGFGEEIVGYFQARGEEIGYGDYLRPGDRHRTSG